MCFYVGGRRRNLCKRIKYFWTPKRCSDGPLGGEGGVKNDSAGGRSAWKNLPSSFSAQAPTISGLSFYLLCVCVCVGGGG